MSEQDERLAAAYARLDAAAGFSLTCPSCGHKDSVLDDPAKSVYSCDECQTRIAFGNEMAKAFVTPNADRRFIDLRFVLGPVAEPKTDVKVALDREYATGIALEVISVTHPGVYAAFVKFQKSLVGETTSPSTHSEDDVTLDAPLP